MFHRIDKAVLWIRKQHLKLADAMDELSMVADGMDRWHWSVAKYTVGTLFVIFSLIVIVPFMPWYFWRKLQVVAEIMHSTSRHEQWREELAHHRPTSKPKPHHWQEEGF